MRPRLVEAPPRGRFTFVVGKGGVGKSTTAAALALAWSDAGHDIHLISTDPAPSLADVFVSARTVGAERSACNDRLLIEELDAQRITDAWLDRVRAPLEELIEQGTYLDIEDVRRLTHLTLPGIDEMAGALRLGELARGTRHVVVDTAPTGHTLRLLDTPQLVESWAAVFRAMSDKVATVALSMVGARVTLQGEAVVDELREVGALFDSAMQQSSFVVVTRAGDVVAAETKRLLASLRDRGLHVSAVVHVASESGHHAGGVISASVPGDVGHASIHAPWLRNVRGCDGLRGWREVITTTAAAGASSTGGAHDTAPADASVATAWLEARTQRFLWFAGKGGVGKSTCAAAVAVLLSRTRSVLLCSTDPAGSQHDVLELDARPGVAQVTPTLRVLQVDAAAQLGEWKSRYRGDIDRAFERIGVGGTPTLDRRVMDALWNAVPPGIDELFSLSEILESSADETIVIDASPTGHFLRLMEAPEMALDWAHAIMRILLKYGVAGELDDFSQRVLAFARQLKDLRAALSDPAACGVFVVTLPEPVVEAETTRLIGKLHDLDIAVVARVINRRRAPARSSAAVTAGALPILLVPELASPPTGLAAIEDFLSRWELA